jgi:Zn-dependent protease
MELFSKEEIKDLAISVLGITLIFSFVFGWHLFFPLLFTVILSFVLHEMAHKFVAIKLGCFTIYKMWLKGLLFSLFFTLMFATLGLKLIIIAPGAVLVYPFRFGRWGYRRVHLTETESGIISVVGPLVNLSFAIMFSLLPGPIPWLIASVNAWLFFFNILPIPPLDGSKIMRWNTGLWVVLFIVGLLIVYFL